MENNKNFNPLIREHYYNYVVFCPICDKYFEGSDYLKTIFENDKKTLWLFNMVMHYRHNHITSWNKCWGQGGRYYRYGWFGDYDEEKAKVNERAKRQIIRKCMDYLLHYDFTPDIFLNLQNTTEETMTLAKKILLLNKEKEKQEKNNNKID